MELPAARGTFSGIGLEVFDSKIHTSLLSIHMQGLPNGLMRDIIGRAFD
jgi:hypothetical protein